MAMEILILMGVFGVGFHGLRTWLLRRPLAPVNHEHFGGTIYQVGESVVAYRPAQGTARQSVIAIHGFLEDFRYFTALYQDPSLELILVNNSGYHCPDREQMPQSVSWGNHANPHGIGTIEHDAFVFNLALQHLVTGARVRAHGHSRGGAVILEAARQAPERFREVEVILEAPVLPGGKGHPALELAFSAPGRYLLPISFSLLRHVDTVRFGGFMFTPLTPRKAELVRGLYFSPKSFDIVLKNLKSMQDWIETRDASVFGNIPHGAILIGARDLVLDRAAMLRSAQTAHPTWQVIETHGTSHFVSLDQPSVVPEFMAPASPVA
jgi:pimeloyl-ACP methyl ester carboxylesterase